LYDEEITIQPAFLLARGYHALWAASILLLGASLLDGQGLRLRRIWRPRLCSLLGLGLALLLSRHQDRMGTYYDSAAIERVLPAERRTAHFTLRYSPGGAV